MAKLKQKYPTQEEIPEEHRELYVQREDGGEWFLDSEEAAELKNAHERTKEANAQLREKLGKLEQQVAKFKDVDLDELTKVREEYEKLRLEKEAEGAGTTTEEIEQLLQERTERMREKHAREIELRDKKIGELEESFKNERNLRRQDLVGSEAVSAFLASGGHDTPQVRKDVRARALETFRFDDEGNIRPLDQHNVPMIGDDGVHDMTYKEWALSLKDECKHYWPAKPGMGSEGSDSSDGSGRDEENLMKIDDPAKRLAVIRQREATGG